MHSSMKLAAADLYEISRRGQQRGAAGRKRHLQRICRSSNALSAYFTMAVNPVGADGALAGIAPILIPPTPVPRAGLDDWREKSDGG